MRLRLMFPPGANVGQENQTTKIEKVKEGVRKLGIGPEARVEVKLFDGRKFKGYIKDSSDENFVVFDKKSKAEITLDYSQDVARLLHRELRILIHFVVPFPGKFNRACWMETK